MRGNRLDVQSERIDPVPRSGSVKQALDTGICLDITKHRDFLLYQATAGGGTALKNLMVSRLIECLKQLQPGDDIHQACLSANENIRSELGILHPSCETKQLPKVESTMRKKFCIGKKFEPE